MSTATALAQDTQLHWSRWFHCESSFNLMLVPNAPGIFVVAEEVVTDRPGQARQHDLSIFRLTAVDDLFHALNRLYQPGCPLREKLEQSRCFLRYAAIADAELRDCVASDLQRWLDSPGETDSPFVKDFQRAADPEDGPYRTKGD